MLGLEPPVIVVVVIVRHVLILVVPVIARVTLVRRVLIMIAHVLVQAMFVKHVPLVKAARAIAVVLIEPRIGVLVPTVAVLTINAATMVLATTAALRVVFSTGTGVVALVSARVAIKFVGVGQVATKAARRIAQAQTPVSAQIGTTTRPAP